jgi:hypothetical protein
VTVPPDPDQLERECAVFTRFLTRAPASPYVVRKYLDAHATLHTLHVSDEGERAVVRVAASSPAITRLADAYARICAPRSLLRKKLSVVLAILETTAPSHRAIDTAPERGGAASVLELALVGGLGVAAALTGVLLFVPLRAMARVLGPRHE